MVDSNELGAELIEIPHEFEIDLNFLVVVNHKLTLEAIDRDEDEELQKVGTGMPDGDSEGLRSLESWIMGQYDDLRRAANNQATVALVTRIQHWISRLAKKIPGKPKPDESRLVSELKHLDGYLGEGPVPVKFFAELEDVRDSVIHADSKAEWEYRGERRGVAGRYRNAYGDTQIDDAQLKEAVEKATQHVLWYDEKLSNMRTSAAPVA